MAIFLLRDSDRGTNDYKQGDVVEVFTDDVPVRLPPSEPFWIVKVTGIDIETARQFMVSDDTNKRTWGIRSNRVPTAYVNFLVGHRFLGFGSPEDQLKFGAVVQGDFVITWTEMQDWLINKNTNRSAAQQRT
jgi:hypothetical protein